MRIAKCVLVLGAAVVLSAVMVASAAAAHDPCKVLTAAAFSKLMGYQATIDKTASTESVCYYSGPVDGGGQFRILTEAASGTGGRDGESQGFCATGGQRHGRRDI